MAELTATEFTQWLCEHIERAPEGVLPTSRLVEDLSLDSFDFSMLYIGIEDLTAALDDEPRVLDTVGDVYDYYLFLVRL